MKKYDLSRNKQGDRLTVSMRGSSLLRSPLTNKGTGFTHEERRRLELEGLLPSQHNDIETQAERTYKTIMFNKDPVGRHISLAALQDRNEHLYYKVLSLHLEKLMPIVYTPTVGKACQHFSRTFRRGRGVWITPEHRGRIEDVLRKAAPYSGVQLMVVTDNESILGIGDQGAGGMAISVGKLALYCAGAGIHPARTLPISLDVGTDNQSLLDDPLYLGWRQERLRGAGYEELVEEFVDAAKAVFPDVLIQWEDFRKDNALAILDRYRDRVPSFNDDIEGTGAVAAACLVAGCRISNTELSDSRILIYGAGAAGLGITRQLKAVLASQGVKGDNLQTSVLAMDSRGMLSGGRDALDSYKQELAWPEALADQLELAPGEKRDLVSVIKAYKPTALVGASGHAGAFSSAVVAAMASVTNQPVILPMSNPTSISEGTPAKIMEWSGGRALVATGSPFDDLQVDGEIRRVSQANNVFIFPGLGLGAIVSGASRITDGMISAASCALADSLTEDDLAKRYLMPDVTHLWEVSGIVALAVAQQAIADNVATVIDGDSLPTLLEAYRWQPVYPDFDVAYLRSASWQTKDQLRQQRCVSPVVRTTRWDCI
jgi:malate dehydrogenase (oxaloacetate-decarboxylating)